MIGDVMHKHDVADQHRPAFVALSKWTREVGISSATVWRWAKRGVIHPITIAGKRYLTGDDLQQFYARAKAGEFDTGPRGIAAASARRARERKSAAGPGVVVDKTAPEQPTQPSGEVATVVTVSGAHAPVKFPTTEPHAQN